MKPVYHPHNLAPSHTVAAAGRVQQSQRVTHSDHFWRVNHATDSNTLAPGQGNRQHHGYGLGLGKLWRDLVCVRGHWF